jgi:hypothetical protein
MVRMNVPRRGSYDANFAGDGGVVLSGRSG